MNTCQQPGRNGLAIIGPQFTERFNRIINLPFSQLNGIDPFEQLPNGPPQGKGKPEIKSLPGVQS
jgi:hypothetical protein